MPLADDLQGETRHAGFVAQAAKRGGETSRGKRLWLLRAFHGRDSDGARILASLRQRPEEALACERRRLRWSAPESESGWRGSVVGDPAQRIAPGHLLAAAGQHRRHAEG